MADREEPIRSPHAIPCVNLCETTSPHMSLHNLEAILHATCLQAGFPYCERVYAGSYFCENYFLGLTDSYHEALRQISQRYDMNATLVVPIAGQAFIDRVQARVADVLERFGDVYDEIVVNDVGLFFDLSRWFAGEGAFPTNGPRTWFSDDPRFCPRIGLGRLLSKNMRDARYPNVFEGTVQPRLSAEAQACLQIQMQNNPYTAPLLEVDPTHTVVDVSDMLESAIALTPKRTENPYVSPDESMATTESTDISPANPSAHQPETLPEVEIGIHLPYCYATTGRNCGPASIDEPDERKFHLGRRCSQHCLRIEQGYRTDEGVRYFKHGRTYYFENAECLIAGTDKWRIIYAASLESAR